MIKEDSLQQNFEFNLIIDRLMDKNKIEEDWVMFQQVMQELL